MSPSNHCRTDPTRPYSHLLWAAVAFGIALPSLASAQNFWKPLAGPPAVVGTSTAMAPDSSTLAMRAAGATYLANGDAWLPTSERTLLDLPLPPGAWPAEWMAGNTSDTCFAYLGTTLYGTTDFGAHWDTVLSAPRLQAYGVKRLPSAFFVPFYGQKFCVTRDFFQSVDTLSVPTGAYSYYVQYSKDLIAVDVGNEIQQSNDFGRSWKSVYQADTGFNLNLTIANGLWMAVGVRRSDMHSMIAFSMDDAVTWQTARTPHDSAFYLDAITGDRTWYGHTIERDTIRAWRSTDLGANWEALARTVYAATADGTLFAVAAPTPYTWLRSTDKGRTWDTISTTSIVSVPFSMTSARDTTWLSTYDSVFFSTDDGDDWTHFGLSGKGYLSPCAKGAVWFNTVQRMTPGKLVDMCEDTLRRPIPSGPGLITPSGKVWVSDLLGTGMLNAPGRLYESWDGGCSFWTWTLPIIPARFIDMLPLKGDTVLFISKYMIMRDDDLRFILDTVTPERGAESKAIPTGAAVGDSAGMVVVAMTDGKLFASTNGAHAWWYFASPSMGGESYVTHLAADPAGHLYAIDSNFKTGLTKPFEFDVRSGWRDISAGLDRAGFTKPLALTNIWYENGYVYAGAWNAGMFRSIDPVTTESVKEAAPELHLELSPNPATHLVAIDLPSSDAGTITVADVSGRMLDTYEVMAGRVSIVLPLDRYASGTYLVMFMSTSGVRSAKLTVLH